MCGATKMTTTLFWTNTKINLTRITTTSVLSPPLIFLKYEFIVFSVFLIFFLSHRAWTHFLGVFQKRVFCEKMVFSQQKMRFVI